MAKKKQAFPKVNVVFATADGDEAIQAEHVRGMICNPVYAGVGPYPPLVSEEEWVKAATVMIKKEGAEQFLVNMLAMLRQSLMD
ncbi:hypothetical protein ACFLYO_10910 [Chloroflexota bacterium]